MNNFSCYNVEWWYFHSDISLGIWFEMAPRSLESLTVTTQQGQLPFTHFCAFTALCNMILVERWQNKMDTPMAWNEMKWRLKHTCFGVKDSYSHQSTSLLMLLVNNRLGRIKNGSKEWANNMLIVKLRINFGFSTLYIFQKSFNGYFSEVHSSILWKEVIEMIWCKTSNWPRCFILF